VNVNKKNIYFAKSRETTWFYANTNSKSKPMRQHNTNILFPQSANREFLGSAD